MSAHTPGRLKVRGYVQLRTEAGNHPVGSCNAQSLDPADEANARQVKPTRPNLALLAAQAR